MKEIYEMTIEESRSELQRANREVESAQNRVRGIQGQIEKLERQCNHNWTTPKYTPDVREAYTIPGDPPGTMGVDWRGPCHVPRQETPKWTRTCTKCGKIETTSRVEEQVTKVPRW